MNEEMEKIKNAFGIEKYDGGKFELAKNLFIDMIQKNDFDEFLTLPAYQYIKKGRYNEQQRKDGTGIS